MTLHSIQSLLSGTLLTRPKNLDIPLEKAFASDLMSDVLTIKADHLILVTGLVNIQVVRTAEISDIACIVIARNKQVPEEMTALAEELGIAIITTPYSIFKTSGILYGAGVEPVY
jgi:uncharacterized protein YfkK (UPF0435 family)